MNCQSMMEPASPQFRRWSCQGDYSNGNDLQRVRPYSYERGDSPFYPDNNIYWISKPTFNCSRNAAWNQADKPPIPKLTIRPLKPYPETMHGRRGSHDHFRFPIGRGFQQRRGSKLFPSSVPLRGRGPGRPRGRGRGRPPRGITVRQSLFRSQGTVEKKDTISALQIKCPIPNAQNQTEVSTEPLKESKLFEQSGLKDKSGLSSDSVKNDVGNIEITESISMKENSNTSGKHLVTGQSKRQNDCVNIACDCAQPEEGYYSAVSELGRTRIRLDNLPVTAPKLDFALQRMYPDMFPKHIKIKVRKLQSPELKASENKSVSCSSCLSDSENQSKINGVVSCSKHDLNDAAKQYTVNPLDKPDADVLDKDKKSDEKGIFEAEDLSLLNIDYDASIKKISSFPQFDISKLKSKLKCVKIPGPPAQQSIETQTESFSNVVANVETLSQTSIPNLDEAPGLMESTVVGTRSNSDESLSLPPELDMIGIANTDTETATDPIEPVNMVITSLTKYGDFPEEDKKSTEIIVEQCDSKLQNELEVTRSQTVVVETNDISADKTILTENEVVETLNSPHYDISLNKNTDSSTADCLSVIHIENVCSVDNIEVSNVPETESSEVNTDSVILPQNNVDSLDLGESLSFQNVPPTNSCDEECLEGNVPCEGNLTVESSIEEREKEETSEQVKSFMKDTINLQATTEISNSNKEPKVDSDLNSSHNDSISLVTVPLETSISDNDTDKSCKYDLRGSSKHSRKSETNYDSDASDATVRYSDDEDNNALKIVIPPEKEIEEATQSEEPGNAEDLRDQKINDRDIEEKPQEVKTVNCDVSDDGINCALDSKQTLKLQKATKRGKRNARPQKRAVCPPSVSTINNDQIIKTEDNLQPPRKKRKYVRRTDTISKKNTRKNRKNKVNEEKLTLTITRSPRKSVRFHSDTIKSENFIKSDPESKFQSELSFPSSGVKKRGVNRKKSANQRRQTRPKARVACRPRKRRTKKGLIADFPDINELIEGSDKPASDEDELPTILPPKRRRINSKGYRVAENIDGGMERIYQEFPRHNWLENKYKAEEQTVLNNLTAKHSETNNNDPEEELSCSVENSALQEADTSLEMEVSTTTEGAPGSKSDVIQRDEEIPETDHVSQNEISTTKAEELDSENLSPLDLCVKQPERRHSPESCTKVVPETVQAADNSEVRREERKLPPVPNLIKSVSNEPTDLSKKTNAQSAIIPTTSQTYLVSDTLTLQSLQGSDTSALCQEEQCSIVFSGTQNNGDVEPAVSEISSSFSNPPTPHLPPKQRTEYAISNQAVVHFQMPSRPQLPTTKCEMKNNEIPGTLPHMAKEGDTDFELIKHLKEFRDIQIREARMAKEREELTRLKNEKAQLLKQLGVNRHPQALNGTSNLTLGKEPVRLSTLPYHMHRKQYEKVCETFASVLRRKQKDDRIPSETFPPKMDSQSDTPAPAHMNGKLNVVELSKKIDESNVEMPACMVSNGPFMKRKCPLTKPPFDYKIPSGINSNPVNAHGQKPFESAGKLIYPLKSMLEVRARMERESGALTENRGKIVGKIRSNSMTDKRDNNGESEACPGKDVSVETRSLSAPVSTGQQVLPSSVKRTIPTRASTEEVVSKVAEIPSPMHPDTESVVQRELNEALAKRQKIEETDIDDQKTKINSKTPHIQPGNTNQQIQSNKLYPIQENGTEHMHQVQRQQYYHHPTKQQLQELMMSKRKERNLHQEKFRHQFLIQNKLHGHHNFNQRHQRQLNFQQQHLTQKQQNPIAVHNSQQQQTMLQTTFTPANIHNASKKEFQNQVRPSLIQNSCHNMTPLAGQNINPAIQTQLANRLRLPISIANYNQISGVPAVIKPYSTAQQSQPLVLHQTENMNTTTVHPRPIHLDQTQRVLLGARSVPVNNIRPNVNYTLSNVSTGASNTYQHQSLVCRDMPREMHYHVGYPENCPPPQNATLPSTQVDTNGIRYSTATTIAPVNGKDTSQHNSLRQQNNTHQGITDHSTTTQLMPRNSMTNDYNSMANEELAAQSPIQQDLRYVQQIPSTAASVTQSQVVVPQSAPPHLQQINGNCKVCGKSAMFLCSNCKMIWYCSQTCQHNHWVTHSHECKTPRT